MNSDEVESPSSSSVPTSTGKRIRVRSIKRPSISQDAPGLGSIASDDNDWVSPFTLPPLPALKKNRVQADRSPEDRIHDRSGSSAYYAAAWGSPYATPSPNHSPAPSNQRTRNRSLDLDASPLALRKSGIDPSPLKHARQQSLPTKESVQFTNLPLPTSPSPIDSEGKSSRRNWLSESEDSDGDLGKDFGKTPTQKNIRLSATASPLTVRSHHLKESVDTITPETFVGASSIIDSPLTSRASTINMAETHPSQTTPPQAEEKPLPSLPASNPLKSTESQTRPPLILPTQSFQRPKKKVQVNGRSCVIAMPMTDRDQAGLPRAMTKKEREALLQKWIDLGYPVSGFQIGDWSEPVGGASRSPFPDAVDMDTERKMGKATVQVHNRSEWDAWISYLKEEKLRALGVTPSVSEAPPSTMSPFSSTMSRVSSAFPSNAAPSPPIPSRSVASHRAQMSMSPFSPMMSNPGSAAGFSALSQRGTPGMPNGRSMHGYAQSVAFPGMGQRMGSPFTNFDGTNMQNGFNNVRSPDGQINGRSPWTPGHMQNMHSMANVVSPMNPSPQDFARQFSPNPQIQALQQQQAQIARQQQQVQARMAHVRQMSMFPFRTMSNEQTQQLPLTPKAVSPDHEPPEIMHPTPRSHRHNLSAALEKGVTETVAASKTLSSALEEAKDKSEVQEEKEEEMEEGEINEDEDAEQEELPILHRPETLKENDEKAEIETNPSIAGTPLLLDDKNPFTEFKPLPPPNTNKQRPTLGHSSKPSLSGFNVQAKEFSPSKAAFSPTTGVFNFDGNAFASHASSPGKSMASAPKFGHKHNPSSLGLNVAAAEFTPSFVMKPVSNDQPSEPTSARISRDFSNGPVSGQTTPAMVSFDPQASAFHFNPTPIPEESGPAVLSFDPDASTFSFGGDELSQGTPAKPAFDPRASNFSFTGKDKSDADTPLKSDFDPNASTFSTFSFGSAAFNVEAPEFKPSGLFNPTSLKSDTPVSYTGSMFGDVVIDPLNKPERRTKAITIVKPQSREGSAPLEEEKAEKEELDGDGRLIAPVARHKRAKTVRIEHDEILFADSAPFTSLAEEDGEDQEIVQNNQSKFRDESDDSVKQDLPQTSVEQTGAVAESKDKELPAIPADAVHNDETTSFPAKATTPNSQSMNSKDTLELQNLAANAKSGQDADNDGTDDMGNKNSLQKDISLSATAPPFEFKPVVKDFVPIPRSTTPVTKPQPKKGGLMASRFAASPSPEPATPKMVQRNSSPPLQLFGQPEVEAPTGSPRLGQNVSHTATSSTKQPTDIANEAARTLERFREHDSGSPGSVVSQHGDLSFEEINAVMKQFEQDPDLGVIRDDTPEKETPLIDMRFRSDAPSPSPRRLDRPFNPSHGQRYNGLGFDVSGVHQLNYGGSGEISDWNADLSPGQQDKLESRAQFFDDHVNDIVDNVLENRLAPLETALRNIQNTMQQGALLSRNSRRSMSTDKRDSDADDEDDYNAFEGYSQYRSKSPNKRGRQQERIKAAVMEAMTVAQSTLPQPQVDMSAIQNALNEMRELAQKPAQLSEADTSELTRLVVEMKAIAQQRAAEPQLDVTALRASLDEIRELASDKPVIPVTDLSAVLAALTDLKSNADERTKDSQTQLKPMFEEVLTAHSKLFDTRSEANDEIVQKLQARISDLEQTQEGAERRAKGEAALRRESEEDNDILQKSLQEAKNEANRHKEMAEEAKKTLDSFLQEQQDYHTINRELQDLRDKNVALEKTLNEYRDYKETVKSELEQERARTDSLARSLQDARRQHNEQLDTRDMLRHQLEQLHDRVTHATEDLRHEEAEWRKREHDLTSKNQLLAASLEHEQARRTSMHDDMERLNKEHRESLVYRSKHDTIQEEVARLANIIVGLQKESKDHQDQAFTAQKELEFQKQKQDEVFANQTLRNQEELEYAKTKYSTLQSDSEERIARLQLQLEESKASHDANMHKMLENHNASIRDAEAQFKERLEQRLALHEEKLLDIKKQHDQDLHNNLEANRNMTENYEEKLALKQEQIKHLESRVEDLKHSIEISREAARAAARSAVAKNDNLPTPAPSVVASPPHRPSISTASMPLQRGTDLPEKISPQALRETIMVLQDQLQNREQKIDRLESELNAIDKDAPNKVKDRDTEIVMLRELLDVRLDDLQEVIVQLDKPDYNRQAVKDAAIRLRTQIKMDQQLRERAITSTNNAPSSVAAGISNMAQSPRAMVAKAAWGNWRRIRDSGVGSAVSDFATNLASTPTRSNAMSTNGFGGVMTPPGSRRPSEMSRPAAASATRKSAIPATGARPLRAPSSSTRTLSGTKSTGRRNTNESRPGSSGSAMMGSKLEPPSTPVQTQLDSDFGDDIDDDASPLDGKDRGFDSEDAVEPVRPSPRPLKITTPRTSRSSISKPTISPHATRSSRLSSGKPMSPRALRNSAGVSQHETIDVFEED